MNGHLFGAGDDGAAQLRKQRRQDARRRNDERTKRDDTGEADTNQDQPRTRR